MMTRLCAAAATILMLGTVLPVSSGAFAPSRMEKHHVRNVATSWGQRSKRYISSSSSSSSSSSQDEQQNAQDENKNFKSSNNSNNNNSNEELRFQEWRRKTEEIESKVRLQMQQLETQTTNDNDIMAKVESIAPGLPLDSPEQQVDDVVSQLEGELYAATKSFDLQKAQKVSDEISQLHIDDCGNVLQVHSAFYKAFSEKDYASMERLWWHDSSVVCIHPSLHPLIGAPAVLESYRSMFDATMMGSRHWIEPSNIRLVVKGTTAIVVCDEHVYARRFVRGQKRESELIQLLTATNILRKMGGHWSFVHHHASWHADSDATKAALQGKSPKKVLTGSGPYLGEKGKPPQPQVKKIIMGSASLSDMLNANLGDLLGDSDSGDETGAIIRIQGSLDDLDEDDDDDDDDDDADDLDDDEEVSTFVKELGMIRQESKSQTEKQAGKGTGATESSPKDSLRQDCIMALRNLCDAGSISQKQKRVLLTDIITCSARGEYSMVEVAYELLCGEAGEDTSDVAVEEFADQCRVFFTSLSNS